MMNATQGQAVDEDETMVLWNISNCAFTRDYDPRRVRPSIKHYLEGLGYSGPFTVTAIGLLTLIPTDFLESLKSLVSETVSARFESFLCTWIIRDPRPLNMMVICPSSVFLWDALRQIKRLGCNVIHLYPFGSQVSWEKFLVKDPVEDNKWSETPWVCSVNHHIDGNGFDNFITHLASPEHEPEKPTKWVDAVTVFWDIKGLPLPPYCDARKVCRYIKLFLEDYDHFGPFTINVIGLLTHVPTDVLRALSSTGIILKHVPFDFTSIMNQWSSFNLPPANTMVLCPHSGIFPKVVASLEEQGYKIMLPFQYGNWQYFCEQATETLKEEDKGIETGEHASWVCSVSHDISGKGFENFITHLSQEHKPAAVTVFWDIKGLPIPLCCEARHVYLLIKQYLEDFNYSGHFTINAIGLLTDVSVDVLRAVSSTGIVLKHGPFDFADIMNQWISDNPPPANMLVLCHYSKTVAKVVASLKEQGYTIMVPRFSYLAWLHFCRKASETLDEEKDKGIETGEHASWVCSVSHDISGKGVEYFITHLSQEHELKGKQKKKLMKKDEEAVEAGDEAPLDSLLDTLAWVEMLSVLSSWSECHEKNFLAVEAGDASTILK